MKKAIVTGSAGFIGSALCQRLKADGIEVTGMDIVNGTDLTDQAFTKDIRNWGADTIFHLAGCSDAYQNPADCFRTNLMCAVNLLSAIQGTNIRLIFASTYLQDGVYAESKRSAERMITLYSQNYGVKACSVRCCNVYGPGDHNRNRVIPSLITKMLKDEPTSVSACDRDFIFIDDVVDAYVRLGKVEELTPLIGVRGSGLVSLPYLAHALRALVGSKSVMEIKEGETNAVWQDADQGRWNRATSLDCGLIRTINWWKGQL